MERHNLPRFARAWSQWGGFSVPSPSPPEDSSQSSLGIRHTGVPQPNLEAVNRRWKEVLDQHYRNNPRSTEESTPQSRQVERPPAAVAMENLSSLLRERVQDPFVASDHAPDASDVATSPAPSSSASVSETQQSDDTIPELKSAAAEPTSPPIDQQPAEPKLSRRERILQLARENARQPLESELTIDLQPVKSEAELEQERREQKETSIKERLMKLVGGPFS
jgi:hypothetical protein